MDNQIFTYKSEKSENSQKPPKIGLPILKIIFIVFAAVIAFELLMGAKTLFTPIKVVKKTPVAVVVSVSEGSIDLTAEKSAYKIGEIVPVLIKVSTGNHLISGVDLVLKYDPSMLEASGSSLMKGSVFDEYPQINIDSKNGILRSSGLISPAKSGFRGSGDFGKINFSAKAPGVAIISLEFTPNATNESNMVELETIKNILGKVGNVKINIQQ